jgi:hypothetical protein
MNKLLLALIFAAGSLLAPVAAGAAVSANVNAAIAYPNPCDARKGHSQVTFDNLPASVRLYVYAKSGELVKDLSGDTVNGILVWDLTNSDGRKVATGVYLYVLSDNNGFKTTGKLAVFQ